MSHLKVDTHPQTSSDTFFPMTQRYRQHVGHAWLMNKQTDNLREPCSCSQTGTKGLWREPSEVRPNPAPTLTMPLRPFVLSWKECAISIKCMWSVRGSGTSLWVFVWAHPRLCEVVWKTCPVVSIILDSIQRRIPTLLQKISIKLRSKWCTQWMHECIRCFNLT